MPSDTNKKLYIVHVGFYDKETNYGIYESHTNIFVAASSPQEARQIAKAMPIYKAKCMHTDGIQAIEAVQGYRIKLEQEAALNHENVIKNSDYEELNPGVPIDTL